MSIIYSLLGVEFLTFKSTLVTDTNSIIAPTGRTPYSAGVIDIWLTFITDILPSSYFSSIPHFLKSNLSFNLFGIYVNQRLGALYERQEVAMKVFYVPTEN